MSFSSSCVVLHSRGVLAGLARLGRRLACLHGKDSWTVVRNDMAVSRFSSPMRFRTCRLWFYGGLLLLVRSSGGIR